MKSTIHSLVVLKGALMAAVLAATEIPFWKAVVIAVVSSSITAIGTIMTAVITLRFVRPVAQTVSAVAEDVTAVKQKVGAAQRASD